MNKRLYSAAFICAAVLLTSCGQKTETAETDIKDPSFSATESSGTEPSVTTAAEQNTTNETSVSASETSTSVSGTAPETSASVPGTSAGISEISSPGKSDAPAAGNNTSSENDPENPASYEGEGTAPSIHDDHGPSAPDEPAESEENDSPAPDTGEVTINLNGDSAECSSDRVSVNGSEITIKSEGIYKLFGSLNGQVIVAAPKDAKIEIELNGINISCGNGPAIRVDSSDKVKIVSAGGSDNYLSDGGESEACIYSKDDITLKGDGKIIINGTVKNAVYSKNTLKITGGTYEINSANNGLVGKDKIVVENGNITVNSAKDGIKATNDTEDGKGTVSVTGGTLSINAGDDAIQAISGVTVTGCSITVNAEGKKINCDAGLSVDESCITKIK